MPPLNKQLFTITAKMMFLAKTIGIPVDWSAPGAQFSDAFELSELITPPTAPAPPFLFREQSLNKYHVDSATDIGKKFDKYIEGICGAICTGMDMWRMLAKFQNIIIAGPVAVGPPGCLSGPTMESFIMISAPIATPQELKYSKAISKAISDKWKEWQDMVMVPGLPWYPAFTAFPGAMAPPMPNVPMPLITCPSPMMSGLMPPALKSAMKDNLGESDALHHEELFEAIATGFFTVFMMWVAQQMVMNVLGKGQIPTFAPPFVPVGPVVGGDVLSIPGHLAM